MRPREEIWNQRNDKGTSDNSLVIELLLDIRDLLAPKPTGNSFEVESVLKAYREKIKPTAQLTPIVVTKINARLRNYPLEIILKAIDNFSKNNWWMEHKGHEGMRYFFRDDDQIERFKDLKPEQKKGEKSEWL